MDIKYAFYNTSKGYRVVGGTAAHFLKADGSLDGTEYVDKYTEQDISGRKSFSGATGNSYNLTAIETKGGGASDTIFPSISFHQPGLYAATLQYRSNGYYFMNINGNAFDYVRSAGYYKDGSNNGMFLTGGGGDYDSRRKEDSYIHSSRDFAHGTFIETDVDYSVTYGDQFLLEMKGNMYSNGNYLPLDFKLQGYIYNDTIISEGGYSTLFYFNYIIALNFNGKLAFWFPRLGYWQGFDVKLTAGYGGIDQGRNRVTSVSDHLDPGGTKRVQINLKHLLTKEELISENTFWEKEDISGAYWGLDSDREVAILNGNGAQKLLSGGLLASDSYSDKQYIPSNGVFSRGLVQTTEGFQNKWYKPNQRNRIWSFGDSDLYGLSYFQGSGHVLGEGINFHFGDASSTGYKFFVQNSGRIFSEADGNSGDWKHKTYNINNYLGADYVGGGQEKPNSAYFGAGKLKLQMLEATQMGTSNYGWSDVLWMSSYTGSDVKKSTAIVSSKYNDRIGFVKQDYDASNWGTFQEFWTTANLNPATQTDLDNYYHVNKGVISNQSELVPNGLQCISVGNSGSNFDGDLSNKILEGTFASFNGSSKVSKSLGFTLFAPTSTGQGIYYKTWYGGNQTTWKKLIEHSDLSGYVKSYENAQAIGFSSGLSTAAPYISHSTDGYVFLATQSWVNNIVDSYALRDGSNAKDTWINSSLGLDPNPDYYGNSYNSSGASSLLDATYGNMMGYINTAGNGGPDSQWYHRIKMLHANSAGYNGEIAVQMTGDSSLQYRRMEDGKDSGWIRVWDKSNFDPGSKVNAWDGVRSLGFSGGNINDTPYIYTTSGEYRYLATQSWVLANVANQNQALSIQPENEGGQWINLTNSSGVLATNYFVTSRDGSRNPSTVVLPNGNSRRVRFDFIQAGFVGGSGNYAGVMTYAPWDGTSASTGDSSYQLAFANQTGTNGAGIPMLKIRKGIDDKWSSSWYKLWSDADFSQGHINNWNYMAQNAIQKNVQFAYNGLALTEDYFDSETGLMDFTNENGVAIKRGNYYKYGGHYGKFEGLNYDIYGQRFGVGKEANDIDKINVEGSVKATGNFKSKKEEPNALFIADGSLGFLDDEIINESNRIRLSHRMIEQSGNQFYSSDNRMLVIRCKDQGEVFTLAECFKGQRILVMNVNDSAGVIFEIKNVGYSYKIPPNSSIQLFVWEDMSVYKYAENKM
ncbi:hypothetical protein [Chryseobacterium sp. MMS23-Vi53]|uniref:hypothetical protein n=1 Tax=Chryseobacterium sp. MMS23-Vi53 TaxID=3386644 RepID=UPI0039EAA396